MEKMKKKNISTGPVDVDVHKKKYKLTWGE